MIVVTGATGLIGSSLIRKLNAENFNAVVAVDRFEGNPDTPSLEGAVVQERVEGHDFVQWLSRFQRTVEFVFHLDTASPVVKPARNASWQADMEYAKQVWNQCASHQIPLIYASSAAVYGMGEAGFDEHIPFNRLHPIDDRGRSELNFDRWATRQRNAPFYWAGLRLFTVYGFGNRCRSAILPTVDALFEQIVTTGKATLYQSCDSRCRDGAQKNDFVHVRDVVNGCFFLMHHRRNAGLYNMGSGKARSFLELAQIMFQLLGKEERVEFVAPPSDRRRYPHFVEARMGKLRDIGFSPPFYSLEDGLRDYWQHYMRRCHVR